ncbi:MULTISPECIES: CBS domain-containing protein [unclassified Roseitalea]|uniref:CBS domain-containing protein n=1 Tax=unclassified Roseitalea TaxID=2639107 RepID=UPI00273D168A|nr:MULTISPECIES: CBS domain-containing protein [unclassified Roseitalea]
MTVKRLIQNKGSFVSIIDPDVKVQDVMDQLERDEVSALVVSRDKRTVLGIISGGDVLRGLNRFGPDVVNRRVRDLMTTQVVCCDIAEPMKKIYELMDTHQIRHVPIIENGELCGIISMLDVVKYRLGEIEAEAEALKDYVAGRA